MLPMSSSSSRSNMPSLFRELSRTYLIMHHAHTVDECGRAGPLA